MTDETGWVIEHGASEPSLPRYWGGVHGWTYENLLATRFARQCDAQSQAEAMDDGVPDNYRIAEHMWPGPPSWYEDDERSQQLAFSDAVREAMQDAWNSICSDTGCHPGDIRHAGRELYFEPHHWANLVAKLLFCNVVKRRGSDG